jgi:hypothetical protein
MDAHSGPGWLRPGLIVVTVAGVIGGIPAFLAMALTPPAFNSWYATGASAAIWLIPLVAVAGLVLGWFGFATSRYALARNGLLLAMVPIAVEIGVTVYIMHMADVAAH